MGGKYGGQRALKYCLANSFRRQTKMTAINEIVIGCKTFQTKVTGVIKVNSISDIENVRLYINRLRKADGNLFG